MKILIAADIFPPQAGGPATYVVNLANALVKEGWNVEIVSLNPESDGSHVACNIYHVTSRNKLLRYFQYLKLLFKHSKGIDVIYAMGPVNAGLPTCIVSWLQRKKFVVKVVGDYAWEQGFQRFGVKDLIDDFQKKNWYGFRVWLLKKVEQSVVKYATKVIVPSQYLKKIVVGWGAKEKNVEVVYNEVEYIPADPIKHDGEKWLVSVGRLMLWKGMDTLIEVISDISKQFPESGWKLKIIGDGPMIEDLRFKIKDLKLESVVDLTGNLPKKETLAYMTSADVFVLNSGYEGFSHVLIEAHNQGVPVLASKIGGNPEVVSSDGLFEYNDKEEIKKKVLLNSNMGKRESKPHRFDLTNMINKTKQVLESV